MLDDGQGERVALIAADLHAGTRYLTERLAEHTAALGLHVGRLFLAGTHNHSGPGNIYANTYYDMFAQTEPLLKEQGLDAVMVDYLVERLGLGVREACARLRPARVGHGVARLWGYSRNRSLAALRENFPGLDDAALRQRVAVLGFPSGAPPSVPPGLPVEQVCVDPRIQVLWAEEAEAPHRPMDGWCSRAGGSPGLPRSGASWDGGRGSGSRTRTPARCCGAPSGPSMTSTTPSCWSSSRRPASWSGGGWWCSTTGGSCEAGGSASAPRGPGE